MRTKEQLFNDFKVSITTLRDESERLRKNPEEFKSWVSNQSRLSFEIQQLSPEDRAWFDKEYQPWFRSEIKPYIPEGLDTVSIPNINL